MAVASGPWFDNYREMVAVAAVEVLFIAERHGLRGLEPDLINPSVAVDGIASPQLQPLVEQARRMQMWS